MLIKKLFFLPPPHKIIFSLSRSIALRVDIIIAQVEKASAIKHAVRSQNEGNKTSVSDRDNTIYIDR